MKVEELKTEKPALFKQVKYWIADMHALGNNNNMGARARLQLPVEEEGIPPFFTKSYFTLEEAKALTELVLSNGESLGDALRETKVCASRDLAFFLHEAFGIPSSFRKTKKFRRDYKEFQKDWRAQE